MFQNIPFSKYLDRELIRKKKRHGFIIQKQQITITWIRNANPSLMKCGSNDGSWVPDEIGNFQENLSYKYAFRKSGESMAPYLNLSGGLRSPFVHINLVTLWDPIAGGKELQNIFDFQNIFLSENYIFYYI